MAQKSPAIVSAEAVEEVARHTVRWTSLGILGLSVAGTIMAFNGRWPTSWRFWDEISVIAATAGVLLQLFCTLMQWAHRKRRFSPQYIGPLLIDILGTYIGFAPLLAPILTRAFTTATLPPIAAQSIAHGSVLLLAWWFAYYPEQNLVEE